MALSKSDLERFYGLQRASVMKFSTYEYFVVCLGFGSFCFILNKNNHQQHMGKINSSWTVLDGLLFMLHQSGFYPTVYPLPQFIIHKLFSVKKKYSLFFFFQVCIKIPRVQLRKNARNLELSSIPKKRCCT